MFRQIHENPDIYTVPVVLPNNPLKNLNCYIIKTPKENLVIDTGFNQPECLAALTEGLKELEIDMDRSTLFLTHLHSDHTGLTNHIATPKTRILISDVDYNYLKTQHDENFWPWMEEKFYREGLSRDLIELQRTVNPARAYAPEYLFDACTVSDRDTFQIGDYTLRCLWTPGHTPGHTCLYMEKEKILFCGDHILFDITPNITMWRGVEDSLGNYLESLKKIKALDIRLALPAHRKNDMDVYERIRQIEEHHARRIHQTLSIVREEPGLNACQIGARMTWSMRGKNWDEFPIQQKWFAIGETISHLDYLMKRGLITRHEEKEIIYYTAN
ncbi:MBL fold metallo-hydrolase [Frisingicoccus sp.]|uniref:MBL fold metallo-hydrolase n=1 Tax=Frisingicoccus sp. TaxID=1918627 RepID=UPI003AB641FA